MNSSRIAYCKGTKDIWKPIVRLVQTRTALMHLNHPTASGEVTTPPPVEFHVSGLRNEALLSILNEVLTSPWGLARHPVIPQKDPKTISYKTPTNIQQTSKKTPQKKKKKKKHLTHIKLSIGKKKRAPHCRRCPYPSLWQGRYPARSPRGFPGQKRDETLQQKGKEKRKQQLRFETLEPSNRLYIWTYINW